MPIGVAMAAILNTFTLVWALTYITNVSIIVQFLIALVGLGVAIDYALLMIFRFRDELRDGEDVETALVETMTHAGRSVIVSGLDRRGRPAVDDRPAAAVHPLDRDRRDAHPGRVGARGDHADAGDARVARRADQQRARHAEALRRPRPSRGRCLGTLGTLRPAAAVARGRGRARDRRGARRDRRPAQPERIAAEELPGHGHGHRRATDAFRRRHLARRDEAVRDARRERRRRPRGRREGARGARHRRCDGTAPAWLAPRADTLVEAFPAIDGAAPGIQGVDQPGQRRATRHRTRRSAASPAQDRDFVHARLRQLPVPARCSCSS